MNSIARPYAKALFSIAQEQDCRLQWQAALSALSLLIDQAQDTLQSNAKVVVKPFLLGLVESVLARLALPEEMGQPLKQFVCVLVDNGRVVQIMAINEGFSGCLQEEAQQSQVLVTSAYPLSVEQEKALADRLSARFSQQVTLDVHIDPQILGGVILRRRDGWVMDGSIKGRLARLANTITQEGGGA